MLLLLSRFTSFVAPAQPTLLNFREFRSSWERMRKRPWFCQIVAIRSLPKILKLSSLLDQSSPLSHFKSGEPRLFTQQPIKQWWIAMQHLTQSTSLLAEMLCEFFQRLSLSEVVPRQICKEFTLRLKVNSLSIACMLTTRCHMQSPM